MKKPRRYALAVLLLCYPFQSMASKTLLCGHFRSAPENTITVSYYASPFDRIEQTRTTVESVVDANGNFKITLDLDHPVSANVMKGESWLFVNKFIGAGDSLFIEIDSSGTKIEGRGENDLGGMFEYEDVFLTEQKIGEMNSALETKTDVEFARYWSDRADSGLQFYRNYRSKNPSSASYAAAVDYELQYEAIYNMLRFGWRGAKGNNDMFSKPDFMHYFTRFPLNNEKALAVPRYADFVDEFTTYLMQPMGGRKPPANVPTDFYEKQNFRDSIARRYFSGKVYDVALYAILFSGVKRLSTQKGGNSFDSEYVKTERSILGLGKGFNDKTCLARIKKRLEALKEEGTPAYDFTAKTLDGKAAKMSDFKGKVVYVDFWATNCAPCVAELPHIKRLQQKYKDRDIEFLYVSFDNSVKTLQDFVSRKDFKGTHLIEPKGLASSVAQHYHIAGIPRYVLVNKEGQIISSDAPRPSAHPDEIIDNALEKQ